MSEFTAVAHAAGGFRTVAAEGGPVRLTEDSTSLGHVIRAAFAATCLAAAKALPKP